MGIRYLNKFLQGTCKKGIQLIGLRHLSGKTIVIDTSIYLYRYSSSTDTSSKDTSSKDTHVLKNIQHMIALFRKYNIHPIFVFDGKPPTEKKALLIQRIQDRASANIECMKMQEALDSRNDWTETEKKQIEAKIQELKKSCIVVRKETIQQVKQLLEVSRVEYMDATGEADEVCAHMVFRGKAWACLSEDMDMFVYGCPRVLRYFSLVKHTAILYQMEPMLQELKMSQHEFREICVLSGTDYNYNRTTTPRTIEKTMEYFREYQSEKPSCDFYDWLSTHTEYIDDYDKLIHVRNMFII